MNRVKIEVFLSVPACSGGVSLMRLLKEIEQEYGEKVEILVNRGRNELFASKNLSPPRPLSWGTWSGSWGVCPDKESLVAALKEAGIE
jgi:hypothetical protein